MSAIDITTMRGEMPRAVPHLLPEQAATIAKNCHFRHGVITPVMADIDGGKTFKLKPTTIFRYRDDYWFAWTDLIDAIRSPVAQDKYERVYFTDGKYPKVTSNEIATQGEGNFPAVSFRLGIPAPANPIEVTAITPPADHGDDDPTDDDTRFYVETYVTGYGEEGPPGPVSQEVTIVYPGSTVDLALQPPGSQNSNITRRRIYRSASGGGVADYLLLVELDVGVLVYQDTLLDKELGPVLETENFLMPPDEMIGLCLMANGIAAGFAGNQVMFSEAFLPYAWPENYKQSTEYDIVAIAPIGAGLVVGTKGRPYLFSGITPSNITNAKLPVMQACVSRRSMVSMDNGYYKAQYQGATKNNETGEWTEGGWVEMGSPSPEEIEGVRELLIAAANAEKNSHMSHASDMIGAIADEIEGLEDSEEDVPDKLRSDLKAWKQYRVKAKNVDVSLAPNIEWPVSPDAVLTEV